MSNRDNHMPQLVSALIFAFKINSDDSLVNILGSGFENTNQEALTNWIHNILIKPDLKLAESILPRLIDRLEDELQEKGERY